jgi:hypothetical protein
LHEDFGFKFVFLNSKLKFMNEEWARFLDEFRKTESYRQSNGQLLFPKFFDWLSSNYEIPKKIIKKDN